MKPQFIKTDEGVELVVLPREDYEALLARAKNNEGVETGRIIARGNADIEASFDIKLPAGAPKLLPRDRTPCVSFANGAAGRKSMSGK